MSKILITRHGETNYNLEYRMQGNEDGSHLTELGERQAEALGRRLLGMQIPLEKIYSSDLKRARQTTEIILKHLGEIPVEYLEILREKDNGDWAKKLAVEINWDELEGDFETRRSQNGENLIEVRERGREFLTNLMEKYK